jgi:acyl-CoA synthetase (AMP-forming)/AMP-acid ligase II
MHGLMMDYPLTLTHILERSAKLFPNKEISSKMPDGMRRYSYAEFHRRVHAVARCLEKLGVQPGDRVGTLCWNSARHLELYFAIPCYGAVLHTLNLRLASDQLAFIIQHAEDRVIFVDASLASMLAPIRDQIPCVKHFVILPDEPARNNLSPASDYERAIEAASRDPFPWPALEENAAAATCYTSGTTGNPKGVLYTHRALFLHTFALAMADVFGISERDTVLQLVPMFHANGWGIPFAAIMTGARIVFSGRQLQPADIAELIQNERVTFTAGVPTLWMTLYSYLESHPHDLSSLRTVVAAGSAMPRQFIEWYEKKYGVHFRLAWGMTETTPIATFMAVKCDLDAISDDRKFDLLARHGLPVAGVDIRIVDADGKELPWDGITMGELQTRGPWITSGYYNDPRSDQAFMDGWFRTGDVATIDSDGYMQIMDRTKDLVKSGGEWISSVDLENAIMAHPKVAEAAVIAVFHPKWQERPLACIAPAPEHRDRITKEEIIEFLSTRVAKWWLPDDIIFIEAVPKTSVGKFNKRALRDQFKDYVLPGS